MTSAHTNHTTRLLAASALLRGAGFRRKVLAHLDDPNRAVAPELGIDLPLIVGVCQYAERREREYNQVLAALLLVAVISLALVPPPLVLAVVTLVTGTLWFLKGQQDRVLLREFRANTFDPKAIAARYPMTTEGIRPSALPGNTQNLIVYSGFSPFIGCGNDLGGYSFAIATDKQASDGLGRRHEILPFASRDVHIAALEAIARLRLPGLEALECYFVNGGDVRADRAILPDIFGRPLQSIDPAFASRYAESDDARVRPYVWVKLKDWGSDLILSCFLRFSQRGPTLNVEIKKFVLTPLESSMREVDRLTAQRTLQKVAIALNVAPLAGLFRMVVAPLIVLGYVGAAIERMFGRDRQRLRLIADSPSFNYGAETSIRTMFASGSYAHYFQRSDSDLYAKTLDREILECLVRFLDGHNIDTSDLRERQSTILNSGIIVQGGNVQAESLAVGNQAKSSFIGNLRAGAKDKAGTRAA